MNRIHLPPRYRKVRSLASGWSSHVYRAYLTSTNGRKWSVVVKVLRDQVPGPEGEAADDSARGLRAAFAREALSLTVCGGPGVPEVIEVLELGDRPALVLEAIEGVTLWERVCSEGPLGWGEAAAILGQVLEIIARIHRLGWVYSDINPTNILLGDRGVTLVDFGAAWRQGLPPVWRWPLGRHRYMGPEQLLGRHEPVPYAGAGPWSDVHQAACLFTWMLTGEEPFRPPIGDEVYGTVYLDRLGRWMAAPLKQKMAALGLEQRVQVPPGTDAVLARALHPDPPARTPDAEVFRWELRTLVRDSARVTMLGSKGEGVPIPPEVRAPATWQRALTTEGFFEPYEAALLVRTIAAAPPRATVLEVGSYRGRSALFGLAAMGPEQRWVAVDAFRSAGAYGGHSLAELRATLNDPRVTVLPGTLEEVLPRLGERRFAVVLIDGDHSFQGVARDLAFAVALSAPGAIILCHDHNDLFPGVVRAVEALCYAGVLRTRAFAGSLVALDVVSRPTWLTAPGVYRGGSL